MCVRLRLPLAGAAHAGRLLSLQLNVLLFVYVCACLPQVLLTLDGYSAPISAGNFVVNVLDGLYNNK